MTTTTTAATKGGGDVRFEDLGGEPQLKPSPPMGSTTVTDPKQGGAVKILEHCELFSRKKCSHQQPKNRSTEKLLPGPPVRFATHTQLQKNLLIRNAYWIKIKIVSLLLPFIFTGDNRTKPPRSRKKKQKNVFFNVVGNFLFKRVKSLQLF